jgi:hypothetical protein
MLASDSDEHDSTVYVGLDVHKESITVACAVGMANWGAIALS